MNYQKLLTQMFSDKFEISVNNDILLGQATYEDYQFTLCGIVNEAQLDNQMSLILAQYILDKMSSETNFNLLMIIDTGGQKTTHHAELLGLNRYFAHLIKVIHLARSNGARVFAVVNGKALGGAFIASGLNAERIYALADAQIAVMWLEAMSKVTKIPLDKLQELSKTSAIFAPGAENFVKLGAVEAILSSEQIMPQLLADLASDVVGVHHWRESGSSRGGRVMADKIVRQILDA